jgi:hypothetical protein
LWSDDGRIALSSLKLGISPFRFIDDLLELLAAADDDDSGAALL